MKLTGKCKEEFEEWLLNYFQGDREKPSITNKLNAISFKNVPDSMKFGVYQDYFDSVGIRIYITERAMFQFGIDFYLLDGDKQTSLVSYSLRQEARVKAIEKANELRNEVLNK